MQAARPTGDNADGDEDWKKGLNKPKEDTRVQTEVGR